jgi:hypothetical protein
VKEDFMRFIGRSLFGLFLIALTCGLLATAAGLIYSSFQERAAKQGNKRPQKERVFSAHVMEAKASKMQPEIEAFGEIQSKRALDIRIPVGGTIVYLSPNFVEGGKVTKNEILVVTDATDSEDKVTLAKADLDEAKDSEIEAKNALSLAFDDLAAAVKQSDLRNQALKRKEGLTDRGVVTEASLESAALSAASAEQAVLSKRKSILQAQSRLSQTKGTVVRRELAFANAERKLQNTKVKAEFDGTLSNVSLVSGGIVNNNERVGLLVDPSSLEVKFRISATQFNRLIDASGNLQAIPTFVKLDVFGTEISASGFVERSSATVGTGLTGRLLFSSLSNGNVSSFRSGDFVTVTLKEPTLNNVLELPSNALSGGNRILTLTDEDRLQEIEVSILRRNKNNVIIDATNVIGKEIVTNRTPLLGAGIKIKPIRPGGSKASSDAAPEPEKIALDEERRQKMISFIEGNGYIPKTAKKKIIKALSEAEVPVKLIKRIESRMGN